MTNLILTCSICKANTGSFIDATHDEGQGKFPTIRIETLFRGKFVVEKEAMHAAKELLGAPLKDIHKGLWKIRVYGLGAEGKSYSSGQSIEGIDSYCPDCDKIYCKTHYDVKQNATGTCPQKHTRTLFDPFA